MSLCPADFVRELTHSDAGAHCAGLLGWAVRARSQAAQALCCRVASAQGGGGGGETICYGFALVPPHDKALRVIMFVHVCEHRVLGTVRASESVVS